MTPKFFYFDMGNVLLNFSHERACRQIAEVFRAAGGACEAGEVRQFVFESDLEDLYETGRVTAAEFHERLCERFGARPALADVERAAGEIFEVNAAIKPIVAALLHTRRRLGVLSNTNEVHWRIVTDGRYGLMRDAFSMHALSFEIGAMKPDAAIFERAAELAGVAPREIFYVDDIPGHVAAARKVGFDAVQYTTAAALAEELRGRGVGINL